MLDHHIQRAIVYHLAFLERARFSDLKPDDIENKLFTYHLKKVMAAGLVEKDVDGLYRLTPEGRRLGTHAYENDQTQLYKAVSVLFLLVRRKSDSAWLLYRRKNHPLRDRVGFMHAEPNTSELVTVTAQNALHEKTGLEGVFSVAGSGYFRVFEDGELESFTHFTLLVCEDATGELRASDDQATYWWEATPDFSDKTMLPNMPLLIAAYERGGMFFIDETLQSLH